MKKKISLFIGSIALISILAGPASAKELHIGVVDMQRAVTETEEGKNAETQLMKEKKKYEDELNRKLKEFYDEEEKLRKAWSILKDDERRKRAADSKKKFEELQKRYLDLERLLMEKKTNVMMRITKKLNKIIQKLSERDKYDYVFNGAAILWAPRHVDMTNEVIRLYNNTKKD